MATRPPGYLLDTRAADRDDRDFLHEVAAVEHLAASEPAPALARLEMALGTWRGPAWAEFAGSFARPAAVRLEERRHAAQELRVRLLLRTGAPERAVAAAEALVAERPVAEPPTLLLAEALGAAGRTADALSAVGTYRERLRDEFGLDPGPPVAAMQARLLRGEVPDARPAVRAARGAPGPYRVGPLIGREDLLAALATAVAQTRLVSLVGPGGVGKTRLAQQLATDPARTCWWVDLAPLREDAHVARAVADVVGVAVPPGATPLDALTEWASTTVDGVLVLDNCEHLLAPVAAVAEAVLECGGGLHALATSRESLGVDGESVLPVAPLPVPVAGDPDPAAVAAVRLFLDRARRADPEFDPDARELPVIGEVCRRLDGLPLALEFAAARVRGLSVNDLAARLDARLDLLTSGRRHDDARHRTLRGVIDWSYALLSPAEQAALRALGSFAGTFDLAAAEAVLDGADAPPADLVSRLVDRSVLHRVPAEGTAPARYRLLESVRAYVHERTGPADAGAADRHTKWVLDLLSAAEHGLTGRDEARWVGVLVAAMDDVRAAVVRARAAGRPEVVATVSARLWRFAGWRLRVDILQWADGLPRDRSGDSALAEAASAAGRWITGDAAGARDRAAALAGDDRAEPIARAAAYEVMGDALLGTGEVDRAVAAYARSAATWRASGRPGDWLIAATNEAMARGFAGATDHAQRILVEVLPECVAGGNPTVLAFARYVEGEVFADLDPDRALTALAEAQKLAAGVGNDLVGGVALTAEVAVRGRHGPPHLALARYADALRHWHRAGADGLLVTALRNLVVLFARTGRDWAAAELSATLASHAVGHPTFGPEWRRLRAAQQAVAARLDPREAAGAERAGRARTIREASTAALAIVTAG